MKKRILCVLIALMLCAAAYAGEVYSSGELYYTVSDGAVTVTGYFGTDAEVVIPDYIAGKPVAAVNTAAIYENTNVKNIVMPSTLMSEADREAAEEYFAAPEPEPTATPDPTAAPVPGATATPKPENIDPNAAYADLEFEQGPAEGESLLMRFLRLMLNFFLMLLKPLYSVFL